MINQQWRDRSSLVLGGLFFRGPKRRTQAGMCVGCAAIGVFEGLFHRPEAPSNHDAEAKERNLLSLCKF